MGADVVLSEIDRNLLERCLARKPRSWEDFVDRFLGLFYHVIDHTASICHVHLTPADRDDLCAEIFYRLVENDFAILRRFRGQASLASYLAVVGRRIALRWLRQRMAKGAAESLPEVAPPGLEAFADVGARDEIERLLAKLPEPDSQAMRLFYLEGKAYTEIARELGVSPNSVGPILSRARERLKRELASQGSSA
ncbi:MAG: sigma-70 family RNA polymerase sigma factor [Thermoguttaceae bacterium]|nr:sigma-70 family RNA polymerase sigma factor [Thermoguttaceae bacterium]MDW8078557.1 sigma-70 family RNA polymerase sigma factor [Thermoguttaceae bacterium]